MVINARTCIHGFFGDGFTMLAKLEGQTKAVTGIALPAGSDKLYSVSNDKSLRIWDCNTGQCAGVINFDNECGTLISEGPCIFVGLPSDVKMLLRGYLHKSLSATVEFIIESEKENLPEKPVSPEMIIFDITQDTQRQFFAS